MTPMTRLVAASFFLICLAAPVWATDTDVFDPDQPFEQAMTSSLLRSLFNQALDRLEDHLDISGDLKPDETKGDRRGHLRFKFYPEGKSKSEQHLAAEGWFRFSPETGRHDWHFTFKLPEERSETSRLQLEPPL